MSTLTVRPSASIRRHALWFLTGAAFAAFLIWTQARALGGLAGLLLVGEDSQLRPFIEGLLGEIPLTRAGGHDGQIYFAIAHDLDGDVVAAFINNPGIRFRRPGLPLLASFGGVISGTAVLWTTVGWMLVGYGIAAAALRDLLFRLGASPRWMAVLFVYPGFWIAARLLTPDLVALGASLLGLALLLRARDHWSIAAFTLAALAKEAFLVIALSAGAWLFFRRHFRRGILVATLPTAVLLGWVMVVIERFEVETVDGNFGRPFEGALAARSFWPTTPMSDQIYVYLTIAVLVAAVAGVFVARSHLVRWLLVPFPLLGIISSEWIWRIGNGMLRSFSPVVVFIALAVIERLGGRELTEGL